MTIHFLELVTNLREVFTIMVNAPTWHPNFISTYFTVGACFSVSIVDSELIMEGLEGPFNQE